MIQATDCYKQLNHSCTVSPEIKDADFIGSHYVYSSAVEQRVAVGDPLLREVFKRFDTSVQLFKFPAHSVYEWHIDAINSCSFNCVLADYESVTLWKQSEDAIIREISSVITLKYEPRRWYLFNSQIPHSVINYGDKDRYLLTSGITDASFSEISSWYEKKFS